MNRNIVKMVFIILTILLSRGIVYSQTDFWEPITGAPNRLGIITVAYNGDIWVGDPKANIYLSTDNGDTWVLKNNGDTWDLENNVYYYGVTSIKINPTNGYIFVSTVHGGLFRSTDNGENWTRVFNFDFDGFLITPYGEIYVGKYRFYVNDVWYYPGGVFYSSDHGDTWIQKLSGLGVTSLAMGTDSTVYIVTDNGIYYSTDNGNEWLPPSNYNSNMDIRNLAISDDGSIFAAAMTSGVLRSTDRGVTWKQVNTGLNIEGSWVSSIIFNSVTKDIFVSGPHNGVYRSSDLGVEWHLVSKDLSFVDYAGFIHPGQISEFAVNPITGEMFGILFLNNLEYTGILYRSINQAISAGEPKETPTTYSLSQNYPNPFNPTTTIQYSIPKDEFVKLTVYDITGRVVKELISDYKTAGKYSVEFNAAGLASGIYFYKLNTSGAPLINKMLLIK
jgi:photosystem II stability/assembly factor-like uncharacterized protein